LKGKVRIIDGDDTPTLKDERTPPQEELGKVTRASESKARVAVCLVAHSGLRPDLGDYTMTQEFREGMGKRAELAKGYLWMIPKEKSA